MKLRYFLIIITVLLIFVVFNLYFKADDDIEKISEGFQCGYILVNLEDEENIIEYMLYESFADSNISDVSSIEKAYIVDEDDKKIDVEVKYVDSSQKPIYTNKGDMYKKTISVCLCNAEAGLYQNTKLCINLKDNSELLEYDFGNIFFLDNNIPSYVSEELEVLQVAPIVSNINDIPYTAGLIVEMNVKNDICINDFIMGVKDYCTYKSNITKVDMNFNDVIELDDGRKLDEIVKDIYIFNDIEDAKNSTSNCFLESGVHVIIIPFAYSEESKFLYSSGGVLKYKVGEKEKEVLIGPGRRLAISWLSREAIEKEVLGE